MQPFLLKHGENAPLTFFVVSPPLSMQDVADWHGWLVLICIISGNLKKTGVIIPTCREIYDPILDALEKEGIAASTTSSSDGVSMTI
jgi:hypothetical protein